jgi:manganese efflux pump family protein
MSLFVLLAIALGLAMDAFAVAIACSVALGEVSRRQTFRLAFHFGIFQALMPVIGWAAGKTVAGYIEAWDHWVAFTILSIIGLRALVGALGKEGDLRPRIDPTRGFSLVMLSIATSIDALAVGLSFAMLQVEIWYAAMIIGVVAAGMTILGLALGCRLGALFGRRMEAVGGVVLIAIGVNILIEHLG